MKKFAAVMLGVVLTVATIAPVAAQAATHEPGGVKGFFTGCCMGLRMGADYNDIGTGDRDFISWFLVGVCLGPRTAMDYRDGKDWHWREAVRIIPYVGVVFAIWDGATIGGGKGRADLQSVYGASYY